MQTTIPQNRQAGFTLIELSIVLVIIGLIVGGVLIGQDLIKAAQMRSQISQLEQYDATVNTFRSKYNGLPGDLLNAINSFPAADVPVAANCNGGGAALVTAPANAVFESCAAGGARTALTGEPVAFWKQIYDANLITDPITNSNLIGSAALAAASAANMPNIFPVAKIGNGNYILVYTGVNDLVEPGMAGVNLYRVAGVTAITAAGAPTFTNNLTPLEAFQIDSKKDDGVWNTGVVQATETTGTTVFNMGASGAANTRDIATAAAAANANSCINNLSAYDTDVASGNGRYCQLLIRASF